MRGRELEPVCCALRDGIDVGSRVEQDICFDTVLGCGILHRSESCHQSERVHVQFRLDIVDIDLMGGTMGGSWIGGGLRSLVSSSLLVLFSWALEAD